MSSGSFLAVDWGTTNRRLYVIVDGRVTDSEQDETGILSVPPGGFPEAVAQWRLRYPGLPMLLAGMVGSDRGWHDAGYVAAPASLDDLAAVLVSPQDGIAIVPGVCRREEDRPDVMRGEEVQLLGAVAAGLAPADALLCQPGTHAKWAVMEGGILTDFATSMTGEMFALLKSHALIGSEMAGAVDADDSFRAGVIASADGDLLGALFGVRAASVLGLRAPGGAAAYVSGLLIGADCRARLRGDRMVHLLAEGLLARLYSAAIKLLGRDVVVVDSQAAFVAGITLIRELAT